VISFFTTGYENMSVDRSSTLAMTPEEALRNILKLVEGSDELEDASRDANPFAEHQDVG
jgi:hypothetical protein